jgi:hypothetical protein
MRKILQLTIIIVATTISNNTYATKLLNILVVDKDYLMVSFIDGQVNFVDDGKGPTAYTSGRNLENNYVEKYGDSLNVTYAMLPESWIIKSKDDLNYGQSGRMPEKCFRKSKPNGMAEMEWNQTLKDFNYEYTMEHTIYIKLPFPMIQGRTYEIVIHANTNSDILSQTITFDIFKNRSEAIHVNIVGYINDKSIKAADLFLWMGNGGARNYSSFEGNKVYVTDVISNQTMEAGKVAFWKKSAKEAQGYNLTASDVWTADFSDFDTPGKYRIAIEGIGCSEDFEIKNDIYFEPFRVSTLGFFYMRIGQDNLDRNPVPRRPLYIPHKSPSNTKVLITTMHPYHPDWRTFSKGDVWDRPEDWDVYVKPGRPENNNAYGGHSDALDWDRHLGHVSIIYDMLLPFILTNGSLTDDNLGIAESGNGIPDILDEARNEVDFWLRLRDGKGYSHGLTNPNKDNVLYQAENTAIAAWANAVNSAMLAYCFQLSGNKQLTGTYKDSALVAYNYASNLSNPMLDQRLNLGIGSATGSDLKMTAAAYLYNITGNTTFEDVVNELGNIRSDTSVITGRSSNKLWAVAAYLKTKQTIHYAELFKKMKASLINEAKSKEARYIYIRPSRRATDNEQGYFKTVQNVQRTMVAHNVADSDKDKKMFWDALILEADWGLGRNSLNIIYMTTATTKLASKRSVENIYTSGRNDGTPGLHPGHTPYINTDDWSPAMVMGRPSWLTSKCYPDFTLWPKAEGYFNTRYVWAHSEFTPQQTMRGKTALYGYLYGIKK